MKITLTEALAKLKLTEKKINKTSKELAFAVSYKAGDSRVTARGEDIASYTEKVKAQYQSARALIENYRKLKSAIAQANATTKVTVAGKEYTIAEVIERKNSIKFDKDVRDKLSYALSVAQDAVTDINERVEGEIDSLLTAKLGADSKNKGAEEIKESVKQLKSLKEAALVDPLNVEEEISKIDTEIEEFLSEVDVKLSIVNAQTVIEVDI